jgi:hypothetical protein
MHNKFFQHQRSWSHEDWIPKRLGYLAATPTTGEEDSRTLGERFQEKKGLEEKAETKFHKDDSLEGLRKKIDEIDKKTVAQLASERGEIIPLGLTPADLTDMERNWKKEMIQDIWSNYTERLGTKAQNEINSITDTEGGIDEVKKHALDTIESLKQGMNDTEGELSHLEAIENSISEMGLTKAAVEETKKLTRENAAKEKLYMTAKRKREGVEKREEAHKQAYNTLSKTLWKITKAGIVTGGLVGLAAFGMASGGLGWAAGAAVGLPSVFHVGTWGTNRFTSISNGLNVFFKRIPEDWKESRFKKISAKLADRQHLTSKQKEDLTEQLKDAKELEKNTAAALAAIDGKLLDMKARKVDESSDEWIETEKTRDESQIKLDNQRKIVRELENVTSMFPVNEAYASLNMPSVLLKSMVHEKLNPQLRESLKRLDKEHDTAVLKAQKDIVAADENTLIDEIVAIKDTPSAHAQLQKLMKRLAKEPPVEGAYFDAILNEAKYKSLAKVADKIPNLLKVIKASAALPPKNVFKDGLEDFVKDTIANPSGTEAEPAPESLGERMKAQMTRCSEVADELAARGNDTVKRVLFGTTPNVEAVKLMNYAFSALQARSWFKKDMLPLSKEDTGSLLRSVALVGTTKEIFPHHTQKLANIKKQLRENPPIDLQHFMNAFWSITTGAVAPNDPQERLKMDWKGLYLNDASIPPASRSKFCASAMAGLSEANVAYTDFVPALVTAFRESIERIHAAYGGKENLASGASRFQLAIVKAAEVAKTQPDAPGKIAKYILTLEKLMRLDLLDQEFDKKMIPVTGGQPRSIRDFLGDADLLRIGDLDKVAKVGKTPVNLDTITIVDIKTAITALGGIDPAKLKIVGTAGSERLVPNEVGGWRGYIVGKLFQNPTAAADTTPKTGDGHEIRGVICKNGGVKKSHDMAQLLKKSPQYSTQFETFITAAASTNNGTKTRDWINDGIRTAEQMENFESLLSTINQHCDQISGNTLVFKDAKKSTEHLVSLAPTDLYLTNIYGNAGGLDEFFRVGKIANNNAFPDKPATVTNFNTLDAWITKECSLEEAQKVADLILNQIGVGKRFVINASLKLDDTTATAVVPPVVPVAPVVPPPVVPGAQTFPAAIAGSSPLKSANPPVFALVKTTIEGWKSGTTKSLADLFIGKDLTAAVATVLTKATGYTFNTGDKVLEKIESLPENQLRFLENRLATLLTTHIPWKEIIDDANINTLKDKQEAINDAKTTIGEINTTISGITIPGPISTNPFGPDAPTDITKGIKPEEFQVVSTDGTAKAAKTLADLNFRISYDGTTFKINGQDLNYWASLSPEKLRIIQHNFSALKAQLTTTSPKLEPKLGATVAHVFEAPAALVIAASKNDCLRSFP